MYFISLLLILSTILHAEILEVSIPVSSKNARSWPENLESALNKLLIRTTHQGHPYDKNLLKYKDKERLLHAYYFSTDELRQSMCHLQFDKDSVLETLPSLQLTYWPEKSRPSILLLSDQPNDSVHELMNEILDTYGIHVKPALMDLSDLQAWHNVMSHQESSALDLTQRRYQSSQVVALKTNPKNNQHSWVWYNQNSFIEESTEGEVYDSLKKLFIHIREKLASESLEYQNAAVSDVLVEIHGIDNVMEQRSILNKIQSTLPQRPMSIIQLTPEYIIIKIEQPGGIDSLVTEWAEIKFLRPYLYPPRYDNTDIAYDYDISSTHS